MRLKSLSLRQFRNRSALDLSVDPGVNLFLGGNGAGKTNIIEAIAVLATGQSPRGADPETLVQWGEEGFSVKGVFAPEETVSDDVTLEMKYRVGSSRVVRQNERTAVRLRDLLGRIPLVSFVPEDLSLVKGEPDLRRRAMNMVLLQVDPAYAEALRRYTDAVKSRNAALRQLAEGQIASDALEPWTETVIDLGLVLCRKRAEFLEEFSERVSSIQERLSSGREEVRLEYKPSFAGPWDATAPDRWREQTRKMEGYELAVGSTAVGPHRDDVLFLLNGRPARSYGSEGQKRTCAVAFKLAEIPYVRERLGQKPICLLDDVLSELDAERAEHLLAELSRTGQCFVTMTGLESWPAHCALPASVYRVNADGVFRDTPAAQEESGRAPLSASDIDRVFSAH